MPSVCTPSGEEVVFRGLPSTRDAGLTRYTSTFCIPDPGEAKHDASPLQKSVGSWTSYSITHQMDSKLSYALQEWVKDHRMLTDALRELHSQLAGLTDQAQRPGKASELMERVRTKVASHHEVHARQGPCPGWSLAPNPGVGGHGRLMRRPSLKPNCRLLACSLMLIWQDAWRCHSPTCQST
jgi:hypothetical protein